MTVHTVDAGAFQYRPPPRAATARRILVKPNLGYPKGPPVTVSMAVLGEVIGGLRRVNPGAEILIVEGVCHALPAERIVEKLGLGALLGDGVQFIDADSLPVRPYPNTTVPQRFYELWAPALLAEVDCLISVGAMKRTLLKEAVLMSCALKNLYGLFPRERYKARSPHARGQLHRPDVQRVIADVYATIGVLFDGAVVDGTEKFVSKDWQPDVGRSLPCGKVIWGDNLLEVDREACLVAGEGMPAYFDFIASSAVGTQSCAAGSD